MDDVTHDSPSLGQISRKRKADGDDPASPDCQSPEPMAVDPIDGLLPIPRHHQWSGSSDGHISAPFLDENNHPTPTCRSREPKRPKIQVITTPATGSPPQQRRKGAPCSPQRRGGRSGDSPHGYIESIARSDSSKSRRHQKASALSSIDLDSPHIPSFLPIPNRDTLKELDLEAVLCNPQLRKSFLPFFKCDSKKFIVIRPVQFRNPIPSVRPRLAVRLRSSVPPYIKSPEARSGRTLLGRCYPRARMSLYVYHMGRTRSHLGGAHLYLQRPPFSPHPCHGCHPPEFPRQNVTNSFENSSSVRRTFGGPPLRYPTPPPQHPQFNRQACFIPTRSRQNHSTGRPHPIDTGPGADSAGNLPRCLGRLGSLPGSWGNT